MSKRRTHSTVDRLPPQLRESLLRMVVDAQCPPDFTLAAEGKPTYDDMVAYCVSQGYTASRSALARWAKEMLAFERIRSASGIVSSVMSGLSGENATKTQKAAADMITALALDFMTSNDDFSSKQLKEVAQCIRDAGQVVIKSEQYQSDRMKQKAAEADKAITAIAGKKKISAEALKQIREQVYGIVA